MNFLAEEEIVSAPRRGTGARISKYEVWLSRHIDEIKEYLKNHDRAYVDIRQITKEVGTSARTPQTIYTGLLKQAFENGLVVRTKKDLRTKDGDVIQAIYFRKRTPEDKLPDFVERRNVPYSIDTEEYEEEDEEEEDEEEEDEEEEDEEE